MSRQFLDAKIEPVSPIATRLITIALTEVEVVYCITRQAEARGVQNLCQECTLCGALSQMMSASVKLRNSFARTIVAWCTWNGIVSKPGETFSGPCLVVLAAVYPPECLYTPSLDSTRNDDLDGLSVTHGEPPMDINNDFAKIKNSDTAAARQLRRELSLPRPKASGQLGCKPTKKIVLR